MRLNIAGAQGGCKLLLPITCSSSCCPRTHSPTAGTAVRFEPGESKVVTLVALAGRRIVTGGNGLAAFATGPDYIARGFAHEDQLVGSLPAPKPFFIPRSVYAQAYGPTVGDLVRYARRWRLGGDHFFFLCSSGSVPIVHSLQPRGHRALAGGGARRFHLRRRMCFWRGQGDSRGHGPVQFGERCRRS